MKLRSLKFTMFSEHEKGKHSGTHLLPTDTPVGSSKVNLNCGDSPFAFPLGKWQFRKLLSCWGLGFWGFIYYLGILGLTPNSFMSFILVLAQICCVCLWMIPSYCYWLCNININMMHMGDERVRVLFLLLLMPLPTVLGWGKEGHYAICKIAQVK